MLKPHVRPVEHNGEIMPLDIQSPITRIRMQKGLTQAEIGIVLGVSETTIAILTSGGATMGEKIQDALTELGLDGEALAKEQDEFIKKKRAWLLERFNREFTEEKSDG